MPHALLLSPDDQAVSAITGVLEEMSVTCERPLDGVSAAQKLNSQTFDLVLVDCENLPAAKLIFDVCRRGKNGNNPVPIAIVDGRAGLPTAFRLGAELILTKPVAKDQARSTIRTAVSRVRKDAQTNESVPAQIESVEVGGNHGMTTSLFHHHPTTGLQGKFSMEFCLAILLLERKAGLAEFTDASVQRAQVQEMIRRIDFTVSPEAEQAAGAVVGRPRPARTLCGG